MRIPTHPGEILREELDELNMSVHALAMALRVPASRIEQIVKCKRGVTADTAIRLAAYFGGSPSVWFNLQKNHDLAIAEQKLGEKIRSEIKELAVQ